MTALRLTPMAAPISLQVMPAEKQLLSCSIRSGVHGLVDGIWRGKEGGIGTTGTGAIEATAIVDVARVGVATLESDGALSNGACIGFGLALLARPTGPPTGRLSARNGQSEIAKPRSENRCAAQKHQPQRKNLPHMRNRAASRLKDANPPSQWRPYYGLNRGPLAAFEREPSPNRTVA